MSVEKLSDLSKTEIEQNPYTQICNKMIANIKNDAAYRVWSYLLSKSSNWKVIRKDIIRQFGYGDTKVKQIFSYLKRANLIEYVQTNDNGKFGEVDIRVLIGLNFKQDEPYLIDKEEEITGGLKTVPPVQNDEMHRWSENRTSGKTTHLLKKEITKQRQDQKILSASLDAQDKFNDFWSVYPNKKGKKRAHQIWKRDKLDKQADQIIGKVQNQIKHETHWLDKDYIPMASTYLHGERWNDEITIHSPPPKPQITQSYPPRSNDQSNAYASIRDFTQERLDRELRALHGAAKDEELKKPEFGSNGRNQSGFAGVCAIKKHLL